MIDSKRWKGYVWVDGAGSARRGSYSIQPALETLRWETEQIARSLGDLPFLVAVRAVICVHRGRTVRGGVYAEGIAIVAANDLRKTVTADATVLNPVQVVEVAARLGSRFPPAA